MTRIDKRILTCVVAWFLSIAGMGIGFPIGIGASVFGDGPFCRIGGEVLFSCSLIVFFGSMVYAMRLQDEIDELKKSENKKEKRS